MEVVVLSCCRYAGGGYPCIILPHESLSMSLVDWIVMFGTLLFIALYGLYKTRKVHTAESYLRGDSERKWWEIGLSVMATQASAITFLSVPGQAYDDGLRFIQFYFGLPLAMIVIAIFFIPMFYKWKVYTAYEYLEQRFDVKTRTLTAVLFLVQRAFSTGITIYAPSIILSQLLGWSLPLTVIFIGGIVTMYILSGGSNAVAVTHKQQMLVIYTGMFAAFGYLIYYISDTFSFSETLQVAGALDKMNSITTGTESGKFDWGDRYNIISGLIGGLFLQLSYFGTDQSQVGRYISGASIRESRLGLLFNGLVKIPVQFFILLIGVCVFVFYLLNKPPVYFDTVSYAHAQDSPYAPQLQQLESQYTIALDHQQAVVQQLGAADHLQDETHIRELQLAHAKTDSLRTAITEVIKKANPGTDDDHDYIFIRFVTDFLPIGLVGLIFAVIFSASMSSTSSALSGLSTTFSVDIYKRLIRRDVSDHQHLQMSRWLTAGFGVLAIGFALISAQFDNLIEAVNVLGSLFYGTILGIFLTAFLVRKAYGSAVFLAACISECVILYLDFSVRFNWPLPTIEIGYLWFNVIGCGLVMIISWLISTTFPQPQKKEAA